MAARRGHRGVVCSVVEYGHPPSARKSLPALARSLPKLPLGRRRTRLATPPLPLPRRLCLSPALRLHRLHAGGAATGRRTGPTARPAFLPSGPRRWLHRGLSPHWLRRGDLGEGKPRRYLLPAGAAATDPAIEVSAFRALCADSDIALYPGFDGGVPGPAAGPEGIGPPQHAHQGHGHAVSRPGRDWYIRLQLARRPRFKARVANSGGCGADLAPPRQALQRDPPLPPTHRGVARRVPARPAARHPTRSSLPDLAGDRPPLRPRPRRRPEYRPTGDHYPASAPARMGRRRPDSLLLGRRGISRPGY